MKKSIRLILLIVVAIPGCSKFDAVTQFSVEYNQQVVVPSSTGINLPFNVITPDVTTNSESTFSSKKTRKDLVERIILQKLDLKINTPSNGDFGFLKSAGVFITAQGLPETRIAYIDEVPATAGATLELQVTGVELKEYIIKDKFQLRVNTVTDELLASDYEINVHSVFFVDAKVLGQ